MAIFLVTVKLPKNHMGIHDPHNKKIGTCPIDGSGTCTDVTGEHHTTLIEAKIINEVLNTNSQHHITRVEQIFFSVKDEY